MDSYNTGREDEDREVGSVGAVSTLQRDLSSPGGGGIQTLEMGK